MRLHPGWRMLCLGGRLPGGEAGLCPTVLAPRDVQAVLSYDACPLRQ